MGIAQSLAAWRQSAMIVFWSLVWLILIDVGVNIAFGAETFARQPSALSRYFEYGRSVEGKLMRMVAADPQNGGQMISTGWIDHEYLSAKPVRAQADHDTLMAVYGQSFTLNAAHEAARIDSRITIRGIGGPGAPPSHSYAAYKQDAPLRKADVVVFGVLSSTVPLMGSLSGLVWMFESPAPFTFPRYRVTADQLTEELPAIRSEAEFRQAFSQRSTKWQEFKDQLRRSDRGYDRFTFDASLADASSVVRMARRGWVAHAQPYTDGVYDPTTGFNADAEEVHTLRALLVDLRQRTCERGERLVILLLHTRGHSDHLHRALESTLKQANIDYISTHTLFSANDPRNFRPDSHYIDPANAALSKALVNLVRDGKSIARAKDCAVKAGRFGDNGAPTR